ncbi:MAG: deoxyribose-phosphate aldolase [Planctomycetota bacterium]|jgi:deoxyribose-phosphate aldolase
MNFTQSEVAGMMDFSAVRADCSLDDIRLMAEKAREYRPIAVFALPAWTCVLRDMLGEASETKIGGVVGFPSGGDTTASKVFQAKELIAMGVVELDMVINIGKLRSGLSEQVEEDIRAVVQAAGQMPVKVIFECGHLSDEQIRCACDLSVRAGARYVKTGTGWADCSRIREYVSLMHSCVGDSVGIKAAGGIRALEMLIDLYQRGARRFGVGISSAVEILEQCRPDGG